VDARRISKGREGKERVGEGDSVHYLTRRDHNRMTMGGSSLRQGFRPECKEAVGMVSRMRLGGFRWDSTSCSLMPFNGGSPKGAEWVDRSNLVIQ